jgi:hypothetical protein
VAIHDSFQCRQLELGLLDDKCRTCNAENRSDGETALQLWYLEAQISRCDLLIATIAMRPLPQVWAAGVPVDIDNRDGVLPFGFAIQ